MKQRQKIIKETDLLEFGKHCGRSVRDVIEQEASYILWLDKEEIVEFPDWVVERAEKFAKKQHRDWLYKNYHPTFRLHSWI